uniref:Uncharacterized protein n=1 Tax=Ceratitis capitata TaxID=7213 RepID=W8C0A8_CERCA
MKFCSSTKGSSCIFIISGIDGPKISASNNPTRFPILARLTARFTATVDFPTPPFPEATTTISVTPGKGARLGKPRAISSCCFGVGCVASVRLQIWKDLNRNIFPIKNNQI